MRIELPEGDDAALVALVDAATQLGGADSDLLNRVVPQHEPARISWAERLAAMREALQNAGDGDVILVDEPHFHPASSPESELFERRAVEFTETILAAHVGPIVLTATSIPPGVAEDAGILLPLVRDPERARASETVFRLSGRLTRDPSPVVEKVLAALAAAGIDVARIPPKDHRLDRLVTHDLAKVFLARPAMRRVIARLAVLRVPFSEDLLERAGMSALEARDKRIIAELVDTLDDEARALPAALASIIRAQIEKGDPAWELDDAANDAYRFAAQHHRAQYEAAHEKGQVARAIREELEEIHHLTQAGDATALLSRSLQFVEQYDALGKKLSQKAFRIHDQEENLRRDAVRAYERAIAHDERDAYAHHYIAYNLDILGVEPERVEREYIRARDLAPQHAWYHGRYVGFLVTRAWMKEARAAWDQALVDLAVAAGSPQSTLYSELHAQIARLLLARSELAFAAEVLEDVPDTLHEQPWWRALDQLRVCLEEDRDERLVFPPMLRLSERREGPHLADERKVRNWTPGRVFAQDDEIVTLLVATDPDTLSTLDLSTDELEEVWDVSPSQLRVGAFVEFIEYADDTKTLAIWDRQSSSFQAVPDLPKLFPNPRRYIRRAFA
ncbi:hypothetical protein [Polyangium sorediatum]|uniref:Uncharacterized protein n=1 Tax=Polyangium sorediatum TaxID=889274 RepID=A0ABT6P913_9BACT|nr:hypothetical protein [Polyangium sorediatum]MDI1437121.1 hypothetical protein [Polyangium sorediatum]